MAVGYAYSILGDFHLAEDAVQEAFVSAYQNLSQLREPSAFPGWFRQIIRTCCHRLTRKDRVETVPLENAMNRSSKTGDPAEAMVQQEIREVVLAAINALPEKQRTVTALFYINGYSHQEISEFLAVPISTVKKRLFDSRKRLKERLVENMVRDTFSEKRPSQDEKFVKEVLFKAIKEAEAEKVSELLDKNPDLINAQDSEGQTPIEAMKLECLNNFGWPGAIADVKARFTPVYEALTPYAEPDFLATIVANDLERVKAFLDEDPDWVKKPIEYLSRSTCGWDEEFERQLDNGRVPLGLSLRFGIPEDAIVEVEEAGRWWRVVKGEQTIVVENEEKWYYGQSPKRLNIYGTARMLPLTFAISFNYQEIAQLLLEAGADPNTDGNRAMVAAASWGGVELLKLLIEHGAKIDAPGQVNSPLLAAALHAEVKAIRFLVANGADPNVHVPGQPSAMGLALCHAFRVYGDDYREQVIEALIEAGAAYDEHEAMMAIHRGRIDLLEAELDKYPDLVHQRFPITDYRGMLSLKGCTLLHVLAEFAERPNAVAIARFLMDRGADVNARAPIYEDGTGGHTPLFHVIVPGWKSNFPLLKLLIDSGADPTIKAKMYPQSYRRLNRVDKFYGPIPFGDDKPVELDAIEYVRAWEGFAYTLRPAALALFQDQSPIDALIDALKEGNAYPRQKVAEALAAFGEGAKEALPALREMLNDKDEQVRQAATSAMAQIGEPA